MLELKELITSFFKAVQTNRILNIEIFLNLMDPVKMKSLYLLREGMSSNGMI